MNLLDALTSNTHAKSAVELSLSPFFLHGYRGWFNYPPKLVDTFCTLKN
jgi:hypothetical protein